MLTIFIRILLFSSWASLYFIPKEAIKRFLPVTTLASLMTMTVVFIGSHNDFWKIKGGRMTMISTLSSIVLGGFPVGTLWIFKLTYGKFWLYLLTNIIQNLIYIFPIISFFEKVKFIKYVKFTRIHHFLFAIITSLILYWYQSFIDKLNRKIYQESN